MKSGKHRHVLEHDRSVAELHQELRLLQLEWLDAKEVGLTECEKYRRDLMGDLEECRAAYVGAAVTEIAALRADLSGCLVG
ncbi:MAG TPA: hypothetical protein VI318_21310 [Baekduia sp.]